MSYIDFVQATDVVGLVVIAALFWSSHGRMALGVLGLWMICVTMVVLFG